MQCAILFFMLILMEQLGPEYVVWDRAASVQFIKPGRGTVQAQFTFRPRPSPISGRARIKVEKVEPAFQVDVCDTDGQIIARVEKRLYVRRKNK